MEDVLRHVVFAVGDEDLLPEKPVAAVALRLGTGAHQREVRAGLRLGQVHGAGPAAFDHPAQEDLPLGVGAGGQQRLDGTVGEERAKRERKVRAVQHFIAGGGHQLRQSLAAEVGRMQHALPARPGEEMERLAKAWRGGDHAILDLRRRDVATALEGGDDLGIELRCLGQHGLDRVVGRFLEAGQLAHGLQAGKFPDHEQHVLERCGVRHLPSSPVAGDGPIRVP